MGETTRRENLAGEGDRLLSVGTSLGKLQTGCTTEELFALQVGFGQEHLTNFFSELEHV